MHAFHLHTIADVYAGGADRDALVAINTISLSLGDPLHQILAALQPPALFAALVIIGDDHRVLIEHRGLQPAIRTDVRAGLLAEAREDGEKHERK